MKTIDKKTQKQQNMKNFILATQQLIEQNGIDHISVRKIASIIGLHNSTIYLYFEDLDQLIMLASVKYFTEYSYALMRHEQTAAPANDNFIEIWGFFIDAMLKNPKVFYNFFFGKRSDDLHEIFLLYYEIFPQERHNFSETTESMYYGKNITYRCLNLLQTLLDAENLVTEENISIINDLIISYFKYKLEQKCLNPTLDPSCVKKEILTAICHVTGIAFNPSSKK